MSIYPTIMYGSYDFLSEVAKGSVPGHSIVQKFGAGVLGTSLSTVTHSGYYRTPTEATELEFVSSNPLDTSNDSGAREITIVGLDANWEEVTQTLETNGLTAVTLDTPLVRLYRWYVSSSGTYAGAASGSHVGTLYIRETDAVTEWSRIPNEPICGGQSQIGLYTVPKGYVGYLLSKHIYADTSKTASFYFCRRDHADDVTAPYSGIARIVEQELGVSGAIDIRKQSPNGPFVGPCDIGFRALATQAGTDVAVEFELLLIEEAYA